MPDTDPAPEPVVPNPGVDFEAMATRLFEQFKGELNKSTNAMDKKFNKLAEQFKPKAADPEPVADPTPVDPKAKPSEADFNAKFAALTRQIESLTQENAASKAEAEASKAKQLETERISSFDSVIADFDFADPSRRQLFRKAHLGDIVRDEDGNLVAQTDKGPMSFNEYLKGQYEAQPWLMTPAGHSGAGANSGKKAFGGQKVDVLSMSTEQIAKLPQAQRAELLAQNLSLMNDGQ